MALNPDDVIKPSDKNSFDIQGIIETPSRNELPEKEFLVQILTKQFMEYLLISESTLKQDTSILFNVPQPDKILKLSTLLKIRDEISTQIRNWVWFNLP